MFYSGAVHNGQFETVWAASGLLYLHPLKSSKRAWSPKVE
jgi:hypothetical protein